MLLGAVLKFCPTTVEVSSYRGCKPLANLWLAASVERPTELRYEAYRMKVGIKSAMSTAFCCAVLTGACASTGGTPHPFPTPAARSKPTAPPPDAPAPPSTVPAAAAPGDATPAPRRAAISEYDVVGTALDLRGTPYKNGGTDRSGFDCSGFTQYVFAQYGLSLPREVRDQFNTGRPVDWKALEPGDLIFFSTTEAGASHVGIAVGGDAFVHAPSTSGVVRVERFSSSYWAPRFVGGRRVLSDNP
jgi:cell wall-associated NlpC family hydrolase